MTADQPGYDAILLAGFGGPEAAREVMPFLRNVTRGRQVPEQRLLEVAQHYEALGGVSPINDQNRRLRDALAAELVRRGIELPVLWGNRNWSPYLADVVASAHHDGHVRLLALATSAYTSYSSCRQYREDLAATLVVNDLTGKVRIDKIPPFFDLPGFVAPFIDGTVEALDAFWARGLQESQSAILFTTHSIPITMARTSGAGPATADGGAYVTAHLHACERVVRHVSERTGRQVPWQLVYQSRSGPQSVPWLEPDINAAITELAGSSVRGVVVVPIGFVSDHVEVMWDLDHEAADTAERHGLLFARVPTPGTDPRFVAGLADLVATRVAAPESPRGPEGCRSSICAAGCCVNVHGPKPTIGAVDSFADWAVIDVAAAALAASGISPFDRTPP
jgi:ferrochelatase